LSQALLRVRLADHIEIGFIFADAWYVGLRLRGFSCEASFIWVGLPSAQISAYPCGACPPHQFVLDKL
jgi:hypothetical protein